MIVNLVASPMFWINIFTPLTPGAGLSDTKGPGQIVLGTIFDKKKLPLTARRIFPGASKG